MVTYMASRRSFGSVRKLRSGRWQAMYTHPETGERVAGPHTFTTKADATRWLSTVEADLHRGDDLDPSGRTQKFATFSAAWLASKTDLRIRTRELYGYLLSSLIAPTFGDVALSRISSSSVRVWNSDLRSGHLSDATAAKAYRLLRQIMQAAVDDRLIRENPCRIKGAAVEHSKERSIPTVDEVMRLADAIAPRYRAMVLVAAFAGLRKGECFGLTRSDIDLKADPAVLHVRRGRIETRSGVLIFQDPKTAAGRRELALPALVADALRTHLDEFTGPDPDALVFTAAHSGDTPLRSVWRRAWTTACTKAGVSCTFHDLRHVAGTLNAAAGATIKEAMARLGHASPVAALRYQHAVAARDAEIAGGVDKLIRPDS